MKDQPTNYKKFLSQSAKVSLFVLMIFFCIGTSALYSQTKIGIAPGESQQIIREHSISILPVTSVSISILGDDSLYVAGSVDSFAIIEGTLKIKTFVNLFVPLSAPVRELSIQVLLEYRADNILSRSVYEDFLIDTNVEPSIVANFTADPKEGAAPLTVSFNNASTWNIIGSYWEFGDGKTSAEQNPVHIYQAPGIYSVSLTVFNFTVQHQKIEPDYIKVQQATSTKNEQATAPQEFNLSQNYPNPFNSLTRINYALKNRSLVKLSVFDINGHIVKVLVSQIQDSGNYSVSFDAVNLPSGIYIYKLEKDSFAQIRRMILMR